MRGEPADGAADGGSDAEVTAPSMSALLAPIAQQLRAPEPPALLVTGSRIERATQTGPSPVLILRRDELLASGRSMIGDILQPLPEQANGINAQFNNGGDGSTRFDLRGLGTSRTLTLLNGRNFVSVGLGADSSVDLNAIPLAAIDRVEILKDSGSAVYGSNAIAGVVNVITRTQFEGAEASLFTAETERNDGFTYDASVITGHRSSDGKAHFVFSAGMQRQDPVFAGDRAFSQVLRVFDFNSQTATLAGSPATPNGRINLNGFVDSNGRPVRGVVPGCGGNGVQFCTSDGHGGFRPFIDATPNSLGDNYNFQPANYLYTPSERANAYTAVSVALTPGTTAFAEASFLRRTSEQQLAPVPLSTAGSGLIISRDSIYNPLGQDLADYRRRLVEFGNRKFSQVVDTLRTVVGVRGGVPDAIPVLDGWKWELSLNVGQNDATNEHDNQAVLSRLRSALGPSFIDPRRGPVCGTPTSVIPDCVPLSLLNPGTVTAAARNYAAFTGMDRGSDRQAIALATAHGQIAKLPGGGDIALAVSADARKDTGTFQPDSLIASGDTTDLTSPAVSGSISAVEAAAELSVVAIRDPDGVERLEADVAARAFDYDTFSGVTSEARALARPFRELTLRTSYSSSFRAPSVSELFTAPFDDFPVIQDPCDSAFGVARASGAAALVPAECAREGVPPGTVFGTQQQRTINGGNPNLAPETAKVFTAGAVLEDPRGSGLSLAVEYWNIDLEQQINALNIGNILFGCYEQGIQTLCDLVHRDPLTHAIAFVDARNTNTGGTRTSGIDTTVRFDQRAAGGQLHAQFEVQHLINFDVDQTVSVIHGLGVYDLGVHPKRKARLSTLWQSSGGFAAGFNLQFIDSFRECENDDCSDPSSLSRQVDSYFKLDLFSSVSLRRGAGAATLSFGVDNVFDRQPPVIYDNGNTNADAATYDFLGRMFYARLTQRF